MAISRDVTSNEQSKFVESSIPGIPAVVVTNPDGTNIGNAPVSSIEINSNYSSAQTNTALQASPGAGYRIVITEIIYSRDTAGTMKIVEDPLGTPSTKLGPHYFPANGGMVALKLRRSLSENKALGITTVGGGNETVTLTTITEKV